MDTKARVNSGSAGVKEWPLPCGQSATKRGPGPPRLGQAQIRAGVVELGHESLEVLHKRQIPHAAWCVVRLRIGADERRRRTEARGHLLGQDPKTIEWWIEDGIEDEATLEATASFTDFTVDTDGLDQQQVVDRVLRVTGWPSRIRP